ncbi:MAG: TraB/GumN family protein [Opitutales bacterium]
MKSLISTLRLTCLVLLTASLLPAAPEAPDPPPPFLWKVEASTGTSTIFGTIHSGDPLVRTLPEEVLLALRSSKTFHPEIDLSPTNLALLTTALFDWQSPPLAQRLPPPLYERVKAAAAQRGIPEIMLQRLEPKLIPFLFVQPSESHLEHIVDFQLQRLATELDIPVIALETVEEQLNLFRNLSDEESMRWIDLALKEEERGHPSYRELVKLYARRNEHGILTLLAEQMQDPAIREAMEDLLYRRNANMVEKAIPHIQEGNAFIAVGLAHLIGENSMITLLREKGFSVERAGVPRGEPRDF